MHYTNSVLMTTKKDSFHRAGKTKKTVSCMYMELFVTTNNNNLVNDDRKLRNCKKYDFLLVNL